MKKYLLSVCVLSLLGTTNAIANNVAFVGTDTVDTDLSGTVLSLSEQADFTAGPKDKDGNIVVKKEHLKWDFTEHVLSDNGKLDLTSVDLTVSSAKDTEGIILKNNSDKQLFLLSDGERVTVEADSEYEFR